jgi:hypothetical protein
MTIAIPGYMAATALVMAAPNLGYGSASLITVIPDVLGDESWRISTCRSLRIRSTRPAEPRSITTLGNCGHLWKGRFPLPELGTGRGGNVLPGVRVVSDR